MEQIDVYVQTLTYGANFTVLVQTRFQCYNKREPGLGCEIGPLEDY